MARKPPNVLKRDLDNLDEHPQHLRELVETNRKIAKLYEQYRECFINSNPPLPDWLQNRNRQLWKPLLKLAYLGGDYWYSAAVKASRNMTEGRQKLSKKENLLADIKKVFDTHPTEIFISSADLIDELCKDEFAPWSRYNLGKNIAPRQVAMLLNKHGIEPKHNSRRTFRGYVKDDFESAWESYLPAEVNDDNF
jgi:Protein of unknown function (DUF3631)